MKYKSPPLPLPDLFTGTYSTKEISPGMSHNTGSAYSRQSGRSPRSVRSTRAGVARVRNAHARKHRVRSTPEKPKNPQKLRFGDFSVLI